MAEPSAWRYGKLTRTTSPPLYADEESGPVWRVAFDPEGKFVASASNDSVVRLWTSPDSDSAVQLRGHLSSVFTVDISPENRNVASGSFDGTIRLWAKDSPLSPTLLSQLYSHAQGLTSLAYKTLRYRCTANDGKKYSGTLPQEFGEPSAAAVSANGAGIAVVPRSGRPVLLVNFRDYLTPVSVPLFGVKAEWTAVAFIEQRHSHRGKDEGRKDFCLAVLFRCALARAACKGAFAVRPGQEWLTEAT